MVIEIDVVTSELEQARQGSMSALSRADGMEGNMNRLKAQVSLKVQFGVVLPSYHKMSTLKETQSLANTCLYFKCL